MLATSASAAEHYIRAGATGSGNNWTDACPDFTGACAVASLVRGDTYYVAVGRYGGHTFSTPVSGSQLITIKKATIADHGAETGWSNTYGDGQAVFAGKFTFSSSNWVVDGRTRNEGNWFDGTAYGFSIGRDTDQGQIAIQNYGHAPDNITIRYVYLPGWAAALPGTTQRIYAVDVDDFDGGSESTGLVFSHMYVSGSNNAWFIRTTRGTIIEYSASALAKSNGANHGEIINVYFSVFDAVIRYNKFRDEYLDSGGTALIAIAVARGQQEKPRVDIYGNVFWNFRCGDAAIGFLGNASNGGNCTNCRVFNNTFVDGSGGTGVQFPDGSGNVISNNLWINAGNPPAIVAGSGGTVSHNAFGPETQGAGTSAQTGVPTSMLSDYAGGDFTLSSATAAGASLASPYDTDMLGRMRGGDGIWDRGAYEFGVSHRPAAPTNLTVRTE